MFEFPNQNTFGLRRFVSHRIFWLALAVLNMFARQFSIAQERLAEAQSWFFLCWIIFTAIVLTAAFDLNLSVLVTFVLSLATFCWRSAISKRNLKGQWHSYVKVVGYGGLATAAATWYVSAVDVINNAFERTVFPLERVGKRTVNL